MTDITFFLQLLSKAGVAGKLILLLLVLMSVFCWAIILFKFFQYSKVFYQLKSFSNLLHKKPNIQQLYQLIEKKRRKIYYPLVEACIKEFLHYKENLGGRPREEDINHFQRVADIHTFNIHKKYRIGIVFLALCSSSAPFIGLLGTVIGVINTFREIALQNASSLAVVAPGLAEALIATAFGIFVAIPALIFYNYFNNKLRNLLEDLDLLVMQILNIIRSS